MRNMITIIKKELRRFFTDKRMLMSLILPGLMIFVMYSFMGDIMSSTLSVDEDYTYQVVIYNLPDELPNNAYFSILYDDDVEIQPIGDRDDKQIRDLITNKELDLLIVFEENFFNKVSNYDSSSGLPAPTIEVFYNSTKNESTTLFSTLNLVINEYEGSLINKLDLNPPKIDPNGNLGYPYDLSSDESKSIQFIVMLIPFLLITFLYTGAMSISIESIAGEKERGTIATLLSTPVKRSEIAIGKIVALSTVSLVSAGSSFIGLMLSIPKLTQSSELSLDFYGIETYLLLLIVLISTILVFVVLISIVSAFSKSTKEASSFASIFMIVNMLIGITSLTGNVNTNTAAYFIPIYNSVQSISSILSLDFNALNFIITILVNFTIVSIGVFVLSKMFDNEKIMFNK
ncbi:MAG: ABC transporter permease [Acholeplasma sp.]|nr:ABC transporter permease [Acholeplasma sp.]